MPRRDVVLTGMIAFAAGCAVGANWPKIRKKIGPMIGKAGFQISELGEFLSQTMPETESFFNAAAAGRKAAKADFNGAHGMNGNHTNGVHRNGHGGMNGHASTPTARKKRATRPKKTTVETV